MTGRLSGLVAAAALAFVAPTMSEPVYQPFAFLDPLVMVDAPRMARLRAGETLVTVLPGRDGHVAVSAVVRVDAAPERLAEWARRVDLQKGRYVESIGRFSAVPRLVDVATLTIDESDLEDTQDCRPGNCKVKLSAIEISAMRRAGGTDLQVAFRELLVRRAADYLRTGDCGIDPYADEDKPVVPVLILDSLLSRMEFLPRRFPGLVEYIRGFPYLANPDVTDSFLYWSKETLGVKPIVSVTHVSIARFNTGALPEIVVVAKQVFASHYKNGSLTMTAITGQAGDRYLVYVQRAHVDVLQGLLGSVARHMLERRVKDEAPGALLRLRQHLESAQLTLDDSTQVPRAR